jgi:hypothetical protein
VRKEKTRHVPYKYKAIETRKEEERRDREKAGERPNKKKSKNRGTKKPKKKRTITKKHKSREKKNVLQRKPSLPSSSPPSSSSSPGKAFIFLLFLHLLLQNKKAGPVQCTRGLNHA